MQLAVLVVLAWSASAERDRVSPRDASSRLADELLEIPEAQLNIADAALRLSALTVPTANPSQGHAMLDAIARRVSALVGPSAAPDLRIRAINTVLYRELGFAYDEASLKNPRAQTPTVGTLWHVLAARRGNCVSLPLLWYAVAERLGYPVSAVAGPQHLFLRYEDGSHRSNIEATSGGGSQTDEQLAVDLEIPEQGVRSGAYLRSLSKRELLAILVGESAGPALMRGQLHTAIPLLERALRVDPRSIETHVQLARALQLQARRMGDVELDRQARKHARFATALGAAPPLKDGYWDDFVTRRMGERTGATARPQPFDVERWLDGMAREDERRARELSEEIATRSARSAFEPARVGHRGVPASGLDPQAAAPSLQRRPECESIQVVVEESGGFARREAPAGCGTKAPAAGELR